MIERSEINHRKCMVQYLNDQFEPATKEDHTVLRVVWDDGTSAVMILQETVRKRESTGLRAMFTVEKYDPNQPRAPEGSEEGGQWVSTVTGAASDLARETGNSNPVSEEDLLMVLSPKERQQYNDTMKVISDALKAGQSTDKVYSVNGDGTGGYTPERKALHNKIINDYLQNLERAQPASGEQPTLIVLGGRGGSGKSQFEKGKANPVYDPEHFVKVDCDDVKNSLAVADGFEKGAGGRAALYHKESDEIAIRIMNQVRSLGLNVVIDATLKSRGKEYITETFIKHGYRVEGYYMYLPRFKAAARAIKRYQEGGRLVPPKVILSNKHNERNFDRMVPLFDKWAVYNNDVPRGEPAKLVKAGTRKK